LIWIALSQSRIAATGLLSLSSALQATQSDH
jgi:hypothetical protein